MFCIRSIVQWEALRGKSFYLFDPTDEDDIRAILYTTEAPEVPYSQWKLSGGDERFEELSRTLLLWGQYVPKPEKSEGGAGVGDPVRISDLVGDLIISGGVSAEWVYREMTLLELDLLQKALERRQRYELENARLWTFISVLPHIGGNKIKRPEDLYPFPWEETSQHKESKWSAEEEEAMYKSLAEEYGV